MVSTPTTLLGFEQQAQSVSSWWDNLNDALQAIDDAIAKAVEITTTGGDTSLTVVPFTVDQSRVSRITISGGPLVSNVRVFSTRFREYTVENATSSGNFTVSFGYDAGNVVVIPRGYRCRIRIATDHSVALVTPPVAASTGVVGSDYIPAITSAMLESTLASTITSAASTANSALSIANAALAAASGGGSPASTVAAGIVRLATDAEALAKAASSVLQASNLAVLVASESVVGLVALASTAEVTAGVNTTKAATAAGVAAAISASGGSAKKADRQAFTGSGTWTKPSGFGAKAMAFIQVWSGGGGGARANSGQYPGGGGGGAYFERWMLLSDLSATETATVGAGGSAGASNGNNGADGGSSSLGSRLTVTGGTHGVQIAGINVGSGNAAGGNVSGLLGQPWIGGVGAAAGHDNCSGDTGSAAGSSVYGGGGGGTRHPVTGLFAAGSSTLGGAGGASGSAGTAPGGGGGGNVNSAAGAGAAGQIVVTVFDGA